MLFILIYYLVSVHLAVRVRLHATLSNPNDAGAPGVSSSKVAPKPATGYRRALLVHQPRLWSKYTRVLWVRTCMIHGIARQCCWWIPSALIRFLRDAKNPCHHWWRPDSLGTLLCELAAAGNVTQADTIWLSAFGATPVVHSSSRSFPRSGGWTGACRARINANATLE